MGKNTGNQVNYQVFEPRFTRFFVAESRSSLFRGRAAWISSQRGKCEKKKDGNRSRKSSDPRSIGFYSSPTKIHPSTPSRSCSTKIIPSLIDFFLGQFLKVHPKICQNFPFLVDFPQSLLKFGDLSYKKEFPNNYRSSWSVDLGFFYN